MNCTRWDSVWKRSSWSSRERRSRIWRLPMPPLSARREDGNEHTHDLPQGIEQLFPLTDRVWSHGVFCAHFGLFLLRGGSLLHADEHSKRDVGAEPADERQRIGDPAAVLEYQRDRAVRHSHDHHAPVRGRKADGYD